MHVPFNACDETVGKCKLIIIQFSDYLSALFPLVQFWIVLNLLDMTS
jgi:hypothetical protein